MDLRKYLLDEFSRLKNTNKDIIKIVSEVEGLFNLISNPNEFAGPIVEAWMHMYFENLFDSYEYAKVGSQSFWDAKISFQKTDILLNIKAKEKGKIDRSRINMSSYNRFHEHYSKPSCEPYYIVLFQYSWTISPNSLTVQIDKLLYCFDLLCIPKENLKIEGAFEGSFRIFISPIPDVAKVEPMISAVNKHTPNELNLILEELRENYLARKAAKGLRSR